MKNFDIFYGLRRESARDGNAVIAGNPDGQPTVKANVSTTSLLCNQRESGARVAKW